VTSVMPDTIHRVLRRSRACCQPYVQVEGSATSCWRRSDLASA